MLSGKGFFIWQAKRCEGGNPQTIADLARLAGLSHVLIKVADGPYQYNVSVDLPGIVIALRAAGIQVWGWQYVYGNQPAAEADKAIERVHTLGLEGFVIDAEGEYKRPDMAAAAEIYTTRLRRALPNTPIALSSYRFPSLHPQLPWAQFRQVCDYDMPQVYWMQAHNAGAQLRRCVDEFSRLSPRLPLVPTGATFREHGWQSTAGEVIEFMQTARDLGLSAFNFWEWYDAREILPDTWQAVSAFDGGPVDPPQVVNKVRVNTATLNLRNAPVVSASTLVGTTSLGREWIVDGTVADEMGRVWYRSGRTVHLAGWLCEVM